MSLLVNLIALQSSRIQAVSDYNQGLDSGQAFQSLLIVVGSVVGFILFLKLVNNAVQGKEKKARKALKAKKAVKSKKNPGTKRPVKRKQI